MFRGVQVIVNRYLKYMDFEPVCSAMKMKFKSLRQHHVPSQTVMQPAGRQAWALDWRRSSR